MRRREFLVATAGLAAACGRAGEPPSRPLPVGVTASTADAPNVVLVDGGAAGGFGAYLAEILGGEGVLGLAAVRSREAAPAAIGNAAAVVVYGEALPAAWIESLDAAVRGGLALLLVSPPRALLSRFGVEDGGPLAASGVSLRHRPEATPLRLHVDGRRWTVPSRAAVEAAFTATSGEPSWPAAVRVTHGAGVVAAWAFDVARNVALIRQGNPAWANANHDALPQIQVVDAMVGWIRPDTLARPDADLYQQTLAAQLASGTPAVGPLPMLDYFPGDARSVMVATSDAHGNGAAVLDGLLRRVEGLGGRLSVYYTPPATAGWRLTARRARWSLGRLPLVGGAIRSDLGPPSPALVEAWRARGHEFAPHPRADEGLDLESGLSAMWQAFDDDGYGLDHVSTRTHKILWRGWVETAQAQRRRGVRMNLDAYHIGPALRRADGQWAHGHLIGSGLPLRFVDEAGAVVDCYQQPTQIVDEHLVGEFGGLEALSAEDAVRVAEAHVTDAVTATPAALCAQFHADGFVGTPERVRAAEVLLDGTLAACRSANVPIWTAARWTSFLDGRREASVSGRAWSPDTGQWRGTVTVAATTDPGVALLLPVEVNGRTLATVSVGGMAGNVTTTNRGGRAWARCVLQPGTTDVVATYRA